MIRGNACAMAGWALSPDRLDTGTNTLGENLHLPTQRFDRIRPT
ncbi:hypothetical protein RP726_15955 [Candidatus Methylospira mobilis]|nr:hypothetical protein [Candidatus Methylospira mobilis]WNV03910.1 hypothetical protein RP726_15955 [Candidatus Methylospira mobilis]